MQKNDIIAILRELADLLEITDANSFSINAYRNAAQGLEDWTGDLTSAAADSQLTDIPSVGKGLADTIADLVQNGDSKEVQRIRGLVPSDLPILLRVRGLGPKRVRLLWKELGIESPSDLRQAAEEGRIKTLRGFGEKTVDRILSGLEYLDRQSAQTDAVVDAAAVKMPQAPKSTGKIRVGTSGYSYATWKGNFYPADASTDELLRHYAQRLATVEINNTFYRFPSEKVIAQWKSQAPDTFRFSIKAHRRITHQLRLSSAAKKQIVDFVQRCGQLEEQLGCVLFQLPPNFALDDVRLGTLLESLPQGPRYAVEFRHGSWFADDVISRLTDQNIAVVAGDDEDGDSYQMVTADFVYVRFRRSRYSKDELEFWQKWFEEQSAAKRDVLAYVKHDDDGLTPAEISSRWPI